MTPLGKPLVFYLKYTAEMNRLYAHDEDEEPDLSGLEDQERVREMVRVVGAAAYEQAADFLELCGKAIEQHFAGTGKASLTKRKKRSTVRDSWGWGAKFDVPSVPGGSFSAGVFIAAPPDTSHPLPVGACGVVVPWLWTKGGRRGADEVWKILGGQAHSRCDGDLVEAGGDIALACIPVQANPPDSFDADRDSLVSEVAKTVGRIGAKEVKAIAKFVSSLGEADED
jgi:hypothetical protein